MLQTDHDLIRACQAGDARAWERMLDEYERLVFSVALNYGLTMDAAAMYYLMCCIMVGHPC